VGCHPLTTTTHSSNVNLPSSRQQVTARLSARKVSVTGGEQSSRSPGQGRYIKIGVSVSGLASSVISVNSLQQINVHHPASSFLAGHLNDTSLQHLPELLGFRLIKRDRGADPVRSRRRLYRACRRWEKQRAAPNVLPAGVGCAPADVLLVSDQ
jgi:hypothetical protein